jgi:hypothetical protein
MSTPLPFVIRVRHRLASATSTGNRIDFSVGKSADRFFVTSILSAYVNITRTPRLTTIPGDSSLAVNASRVDRNWYVAGVNSGMALGAREGRGKRLGDP